MVSVGKIPSLTFNIKGDNLKTNSKVFGIVMALLAMCIVISAASAVDLANDFKSNDFTVKVASGTDFTETVHVSTNDMNFMIFENSDKNSKDVSSIMMFKDSTADKKEMNTFIKDLEKTGDKVEETDKYVALKNTQKLPDGDIGSDLEGIFSIANDVFSSEGLNVSAEGNSVSLSGKSFEVSTHDGENISVTPAGVSFSGGASSGNESVNISGDVNSSIKNCDYSVYLKNNNGVFVISGNNLELLKSMAETVSFNGN